MIQESHSGMEHCTGLGAKGSAGDCGLCKSQGGLRRVKNEVFVEISKQEMEII